MKMYQLKNALVAAEFAMRLSSGSPAPFKRKLDALLAEKGDRGLRRLKESLHELGLFVEAVIANGKADIVINVSSSKEIEQ